MLAIDTNVLVYAAHAVSRVAPPTITITNIKAATASSQSLTARRAADAQGSSCGHSIAGIGGWEHA